MTSITWAGPRCVQEAAAILGPQNRIQGRCEIFLDEKAPNVPSLNIVPSILIIFKHCLCLALRSLERNTDGNTDTDGRAEARRGRVRG